MNHRDGGLTVWLAPVLWSTAQASGPGGPGVVSAPGSTCGREVQVVGLRGSSTRLGVATVSVRKERAAAPPPSPPEDARSCDDPLSPPPPRPEGVPIICFRGHGPGARRHRGWVEPTWRVYSIQCRSIDRSMRDATSSMLFPYFVTVIFFFVTVIFTYSCLRASR